MRYWLWKSLKHFKVAYICMFLSLPYPPATHFPSASSTKGIHINTQSQREIMACYFIFTPGPYVKYWLLKMSPKLSLIAQSRVCSYHGKGEQNLDIILTGPQKGKGKVRIFIEILKTYLDEGGSFNAGA